MECHRVNQETNNDCVLNGPGLVVIEARGEFGIASFLLVLVKMAKYEPIGILEAIVSTNKRSTVSCNGRS